MRHNDNRECGGWGGGGGLGAGGRNARSGAEDHILTPVGQTSGVLLNGHLLSCIQPVELTTSHRTAGAKNVSQHGRWPHHGTPLVDRIRPGTATIPMLTHTPAMVLTDQKMSLKDIQDSGPSRCPLVLH